MRKLPAINGTYILGFICHYIIVILFGIAMIGKIMDPNTSMEFISAVLKTNELVTGMVLWSVVTLEGSIVISLIIFGSQMWPFYMTAGVLTAFTLLIAYGMYIDLEALCGCFGSVIESTTEKHPVY